MPRKVFLSYDYERDRYRIGKVRDCLLKDPDVEIRGIWDENSWDLARMRGEEAVHQRIRKELEETSVTIVLIGYDTSGKGYINYTISESCNHGNALLGIFIDKLEDIFGCVDLKGPSPLHEFRISDSETLADIFPTYDWVRDKGDEKISVWIKETARVIEG